jgi:hypothetical protein
MKRFLLPVMSMLMTYTAFAQECSNDDFVSFCKTKTAVLRLLSYPAYTASDEKVLNRAGDMAALAVIRSVSMEDLNSAEKTRKVLLILSLAFAAPQLIAASTNRRPTAAMLLLDRLCKANCDQEIQNIRNEIQHNTSTGRPYEVVTLEGDPPLDMEHWQWVASVLRSTYEIKPGMTRKDLLRVYTIEGGLSTRTQRTYVLKGCPGIKVDVEFVPVGNAQNGLNENPNDRILKLSKPYLDFFRVD